MTKDEALEWANNFVADSKIEEAIIATIRHIYVDVSNYGTNDVKIDIDPAIFKAHLASWKRAE